MKTKSISRRISKLSGGAQALALAKSRPPPPYTPPPKDIPSPTTTTDKVSLIQQRNQHQLQQLLQQQQQQTITKPVPTINPVNTIASTGSNFVSGLITSVAPKLSTLQESQESQDCKTFKTELDFDESITNAAQGPTAIKLKQLYENLKKQYYHIETTAEPENGKNGEQRKNAIAIVIKKDTVNHTNIFFQHVLDMEKYKVPVLLRCVKSKESYTTFNSPNKIELHGIYFMGFDTGIKKSNLSTGDSHIIHDLYKLTEDGAKLNKTDMTIFRRGKDGAIAKENEAEPVRVIERLDGETTKVSLFISYIQNLAYYIKESRKNIFSSLIILKLPTDHNILKTFSKDALMRLKSVPVAIGQTVAVGLSIGVGALAGTLVGVGSALALENPGKGYDVAKRIVGKTISAVSGGKKRTKKKTRINKSRLSLRRSRKL
jgi:hypothetical protein